MEHENANWGQSVAGIVIRDNRVLLVRHSYGVRKGRLIVPGGYVNEGESPMDAVRREVFEETQVTVEPTAIVGIRFNQKDWYVAFRADYVSGEPVSDHDENTEALWVDVEAALSGDEAPDLTKKLIQCALAGGALEPIGYDGTLKYGPYALYGVRAER